MKHCAVAAALAWLAMSCGLLSTPVAAGQVEQKRFTAKSYPGSRDRDYKVFVPASYTGQTPVPMVMVLHGCSQTEQNMLAETRFRELAERDGFIAVYPFITSFDGLRSPNCWGFFIDQHIHEGAGEAEDLYQIAREVETAFKIDPNRRYVTGLLIRRRHGPRAGRGAQRIFRGGGHGGRPPLFRDGLVGPAQLQLRRHLPADLVRGRSDAG